MSKSISLFGKSWVVGIIDAVGSFGIMQVFDIAQHGSSSDEDYWAGADRRAHDAAVKAMNGWQNHFIRTCPTDTLVVRMVSGGRCDVVVNKV